MNLQYKNVAKKSLQPKEGHLPLIPYCSKQRIKHLFAFRMLCWPCISIHLCNKNQLDTLFILRLFCQPTSTCFGYICSPSSGGTLCAYNNWYVLCFSVECLLAGLANWQSTEKHNTYQLLHMYSVPPHDGLQICPKHVEVEWRYKLRINSASSWFSLHRSVCIPFLSYWLHMTFARALG